MELLLDSVVDSWEYVISTGIYKLFRFRRLEWDICLHSIGQK